MSARVFPDRTNSREWRVEYEDSDSGCYVTIFAGPKAEERARAYSGALNAGKLETIREALPDTGPPKPRLKVVLND